MTLESLKRKARKYAAMRNHHLGNFLANANRSAASAQCQHCNMWVTVRVKPQPNEIDIGGEAVGMNCTGHRRML